MIFEPGKFPFGYKRGKFVMLFNPLGKDSEIKINAKGAKKYMKSVQQRLLTIR